MADPQLETDCDVLVIGSGAGGLTAAVTARFNGLDVVVAEKAPLFGGSSALSGGWLWIPCNPAAVADGVQDTIDAAKVYIRSEMGDFYQESRIAAYLDAGPRMVAFLEQKTDVHFQSDYTFSDYHPDLPGGVAGGRSIVAAPFDGRQLGKQFPYLQPPLRQLTFMGLTIGSGERLKHFLNVTRSARSAVFVLKLITQYAIHRVRYGRGVQLYNGNALVARLAKTAFDRGVKLWLSATAVSLIHENRRVVGAAILKDGQRHVVKCRRGLILATGGFSHDETLRGALLPREQAVSIAPVTATGDGVRMATAAGGCMSGGRIAPAYSCLFSLLPRKNAQPDLIPHFVDRAKPGIILIDFNGRRFCNESNSYHDVARAMIAQGIDGKSRKAFLIADHRAIRRYGLGAVRPAPMPMKSFLENGYLLRARTLGELAAAIGVNTAAIEATIGEFNKGALRGEDPAYGRGKSAYNAFQGDYGHKPNACLGPLSTPPYYAVAVQPGDFGTFVGVSVDSRSRVIDGDGEPIEGLYAVGNDSANVFEGACLGGGVTVGPAMVFGFIAGNDVAKAANQA